MDGGQNWIAVAAKNLWLCGHLQRSDVK
jgi:hypothetical protein